MQLRGLCRSYVVFVRLSFCLRKLTYKKTPRAWVALLKNKIFFDRSRNQHWEPEIITLQMPTLNTIPYFQKIYFLPIEFEFAEFRFFACILQKVMYCRKEDGILLKWVLSNLWSNAWSRFQKRITINKDSKNIFTMYL